MTDQTLSEQDLPGTVMLQATSLAGRYAKALFELALEHDVLNKTHQELQKLQSLVRGSDELKNVFVSQVITRTQHVAVLQTLGEKLELSPLLTQFLMTIAQNRRLSCFDEMVAAFSHFVDLQSHVHHIDVVCAYALTNAQKQTLKDILNKSMVGQLTIGFSLDPSILGGILIREGSRLIDATLKTQLNQLATAMKGTV